MDSSAVSQNGHSAARPPASSQLAGSRSGPGDPIGSRLFRTIARVWSTERGRRRLFYVGGLVAVVVIVGFGALWVSAMSGKTQSYWDGYSAGGTAYGAHGSESAQRACKMQELQSPRLGGRPQHDIASQWMQGCVAAFNATADDN